MSGTSRLPHRPVFLLAHPEGPGHCLPSRCHVRRYADPVLDGGAVRLDGPIADRDERVRVKAIAKMEKATERIGVDRAQAQRGGGSGHPHRLQRETPARRSVDGHYSPGKKPVGKAVPRRQIDGPNQLG